MSQPERRPDWLRPDAATRKDTDGTEATSTAAGIPARSTETSPPSSLKAATEQTNSVAPVASSEWRIEPMTTIFEPVREDRSVNRKLRGIHLFMITVNGTLGTGLYWRSGQVLELGGPLAVLLSFLLVGLLAWAVMQCITELLCIWPIPGALHVYVAEFVDMELGIAAGMAYWFTYAVSYAALIATAASEFNFWIDSMDLAKQVDAGLIYVLIPLILIGVNSFGVQTYGFVEVVSGFMKIAFLLVIAILLIAIKAGAHDMTSAGIASSNWKSLTAKYDPDASTGFANALFMSFSISSFAYVGVEIIAASALEARPQVKEDTSAIPWRKTQEARSTMIGRTVKFSSIFISVLATIAYTFSGTLVTLGIKWDDPNLPRVSWSQQHTSCENDTPTWSPGGTSSAFVLIARASGFNNLDHVFNVFLFLTAITCANTNLYVASRALFALTSRLDVTAGQSWHLRALAWFGKTNHRKVPMRAMVSSALAFCWVPFIQLGKNGTESCSTGGMIVEVLAEMGSIGVFIVWSCNCLAFIRYYHCIKRHSKVLESQKVAQVRRFDSKNWNDYPYRSHGQPFLAYLALAGCLFILVVANGSSLWKGFKPVPFLSSYIIVMVFIALWAVLKISRGARWSWANLSEAEDVVRKIRKLHEIRLAAT